MTQRKLQFLGRGALAALAIAVAVPTAQHDLAFAATDDLPA